MLIVVDQQVGFVVPQWSPIGFGVPEGKGSTVACAIDDFVDAAETRPVYEYDVPVRLIVRHDRLPMYAGRWSCPIPTRSRPPRNIDWIITNA